MTINLGFSKFKFIHYSIKITILFLLNYFIICIWGLTFNYYQ